MRIGVAGVGRIGAFHASTLAALPQVEEVVVCDIDSAGARALADAHDYGFAGDLPQLLPQVDGLVIATSTTSHAEALRAAVATGTPTFCEKPIAASLEETIELVHVVESSTTPVQVGFQRRQDRGYRAAREAVSSGELGFVHSVRAYTHDRVPPPAAYLPASGGLFRDCNVHDFDIIRFVTGREVTSAYGVGANKGEPFFADAGDVDTAAAVLTLDDHTLALVSATRYNGGGHDVRLEVAGSKGTIGVGYDDSLAVTSAETQASYPTGPRHNSFMERFEPAYRTELEEFCRVVAGELASPCTVRDALEAARIAEACQRSMETGRPVRLTEVDGAP